MFVFQSPVIHSRSGTSSAGPSNTRRSITGGGLQQTRSKSQGNNSKSKSSTSQKKAPAQTNAIPSTSSSSPNPSINLRAHFEELRTHQPSSRASVNKAPVLEPTPRPQTARRSVPFKQRSSSIQPSARTQSNAGTSRTSFTVHPPLQSELYSSSYEQWRKDNAGNDSSSYPRVETPNVKRSHPLPLTTVSFVTMYVSLSNIDFYFISQKEGELEHLSCFERLNEDQFTRLHEIYLDRNFNINCRVKYTKFTPLHLLCRHNKDNRQMFRSLQLLLGNSCHFFLKRIYSII